MAEGLRHNIAERVEHPPRITEEVAAQVVQDGYLPADFDPTVRYETEWHVHFSLRLVQGHAYCLCAIFQRPTAYLYRRHIAVTRRPDGEGYVPDHMWPPVLAEVRKVVQDGQRVSINVVRDGLHLVRLQLSDKCLSVGWQKGDAPLPPAGPVIRVRDDGELNRPLLLGGESEGVVQDRKGVGGVVEGVPRVHEEVAEQVADEWGDLAHMLGPEHMNALVTAHTMDQTVSFAFAQTLEGFADFRIECAEVLRRPT